MKEAQRLPFKFFRSYSSKAGLNKATLFKQLEERFQSTEDIELLRGVRWPFKELPRVSKTLLGGEPLFKRRCGTLMIPGIKQSPMSYDSCNGMFIILRVPKESIHYVFPKDSYTMNGQILGKKTPPLKPEEVIEKLKFLGGYIIENGGDMINNKGWFFTPNARQLNEVIFDYRISDICKIGIASHRPGHIIEYLQQKLADIKIKNLDRNGIFSLVRHIKPLLDLKYSQLELQHQLSDSHPPIEIINYDGRHQVPMEITREHWAFVDDCCAQVLAHPEFQAFASGDKKDEIHTPQTGALLKAHKALESAGKLTPGKSLRQLWQTPKTLVEDVTEQLSCVVKAT